MITSAQQVRLVLADDHAILRDGLRRLLEDEPNYKVVGEASDGDQAIGLVRQLKPDVLLLDLSMPKLPGMEALRELSVHGSPAPVRVIVLTAAIETREIVQALQLGARGIVFKDSASQLLLTALRAVLAGEYWIGRATVPNVMQYLQTLTQSVKEETTDKKFGLTPRELEIISTVVGGFANKEIALHWKIGEDTVKHHLSNVFDKTGVSSRLELALFAVNHNLPLKPIAPQSEKPQDKNAAHPPRPGQDKKPKKPDAH